MLCNSIMELRNKIIDNSPIWMLAVQEILYFWWIWFPSFTRFDLIFLTISISILFDYQFLGIKRSSGKMAALKSAHSKIEANVKRAHNRSKHHFFSHSLFPSNFMFCAKFVVPNCKRTDQLYNESNFKSLKHELWYFKRF